MKEKTLKIEIENLKKAVKDDKNKLFNRDKEKITKNLKDIGIKFNSRRNQNNRISVRNSIG